jgi:exodeoxyribonuclease V beta subunit
MRASERQRTSGYQRPAWPGNAATVATSFDVCGPLPTGVTVLEASAGTGKTFTIAALATRYVAEGTPLEHMLLVTFGRMATGELRARVRDQLVAAERGLANALAGVPPPPGDEVLLLLATAGPAELDVRRRRLAGALADFDAATIATTHGFCQHILSGLGVAGDVETDVTFVEDPSDLVDEVVEDLYVRKFRRHRPRFDLAEARRIGRIAVGNPDAALEPSGDDDTSWAMRRRLADAVRAEVEHRKRQAKILTYDDLLTRLASTLTDDERGPAACTRLRERYRIALVDEFQDTDPIQWDIVRRAFGGDATLVLIGDPKQAIYSFRGADVYAYLDAARTAGTTATLGVNWRSDQRLVDAYDALFAGATLGHPGIEYRTVRAAGAHLHPRLRASPHDAALRVRVVHRRDGAVDLTDRGWAVEQSTREHVADDLAADVVALLQCGAEVIARDSDGAEVGAETVRPGHVAVLVGTHRQGALVREALDAVGVPAVINGAGSVFAAPAARDWLALLEALERPASPTRVRAAALSSFGGWTAERIAGAGDAAWEDVYARVHDWADLLRRRGVAALLEAVTRSEQLPGRLLVTVGGERTLTDLRHIGQLLHQEAMAEQLGVTALAAWLRRRVADAADDNADEDRSRRLESDSAAVQVLTIHRSKGLEFPIVYCPYLWNARWIPLHEPPVFHDEDAGDRRTIDVGGRRGSREFDRRWRQHVAEQRGEELRLAYVALTRARHQAVLWWASSYGSRQSALARLLFDPTVAELRQTPDEGEVEARLAEIAAKAPGAVSVERSEVAAGVRWSSSAVPGERLGARPFHRTLDAGWRRASYTSITAEIAFGHAGGAHEVDVASEPEETGITDEQVPIGPLPTVPDRGGDDDSALQEVTSALEAMPGGARVGSLVHAVLERTDFASEDLDAALAARLAERLAWSNVDVGPPDALAAGLRAAIETPLGPLVGDVRLRDVSRADRVDELAFELPLAGGDEPTGQLDVAALADVLDAHLEAGDPLAGYADRLRDGDLQQRLRGYLTGSLDAVLRVGGGGGRFVVVDYKTNWLGTDGAPLTAWHYRPAALAAAMQRAHYPLQALFYVVALHRYLRWRLPGYRPERQLAGVLYLFVRGMSGAATPRVDGQPCGVFSWRPSPPLVTALSDLLDRGVRR